MDLDESELSLPRANPAIIGSVFAYVQSFFESTDFFRKEYRRSWGRKILLVGIFSKPRKQFRPRVLA
jgi:hypothetical protein